VLDGRGGTDLLDGGAGIDAIYYNHALSGVTVNLVSLLPSLQDLWVNPLLTSDSPNLIKLELKKDNHESKRHPRINYWKP
jgi:hypothetical protein